MKMASNEDGFDENLLIKEQLCCGGFWRHSKATLLKRIRVIKRDLKSFLFELILPLVIITLALLLMRVSFITDQPEQRYNMEYYTNDSSPMIFGLAAADATRLG